MNRIFVVFVYDTPSCPPDGEDPRLYRQGRCLGAFAHKLKAQQAVERENYRMRYPSKEPSPTWVNNLVVDTKFLMSADKPATYYGYIECVRFDRRERERRVPTVADRRELDFDRPPPVEG